MAIVFSCPHCSREFQVDDSYAGQSGPCAGCNKQIRVPGEPSAFAGSARQDPPPRKGMSMGAIIGILVGGFFLFLMCGGVVLALLLPAVQTARDAARRNQCINNSKQIALALHNHHDIHNRLPLASTAPVTGTPGDATTAGYSWITALLPFMEQVTTWDEIYSASNKFRTLPFDPQLSNSSSGAPLASLNIPLLLCASADAPQLSDSAKGIYSSVPLPGLTNYIANAGSHLVNNQGPAQLFPVPDIGGVSGNGTLVFPVEYGELGPPSPNKGLGFKAMTDGTSKTVFFCESKETTYAAWIDGQATWCVAAWPENSDLPTVDGSADGYLGWPDSDTKSKTSLQVAQEIRDFPFLFYMSSSRFGGGVNRQLGPSSNHVGDVVIHTFADGHVLPIRSNIDRTAYLRLFSRNGGDFVNSRELD